MQIFYQTWISKLFPRKEVSGLDVRFWAKNLWYFWAHFVQTSKWIVVQQTSVRLVVKRLKKPIRFFLYGKEAPGLFLVQFVGKLLTSTSSCRMRSLHTRDCILLKAQGPDFPQLERREMTKFPEPCRSGLSIAASGCWLLPDCKCGNASSAWNLHLRCVGASILAPEKAN